MATATTSPRLGPALSGAVRPFRLQGRQRMGGHQCGQGEAHAEMRLYAAWPQPWGTATHPAGQPLTPVTWGVHHGQSKGGSSGEL